MSTSRPAPLRLQDAGDDDGRCKPTRRRRTDYRFDVVLVDERLIDN
ncbi:hypothetical protein ABT263_28060 [Kitasatospora sp. NPDC001603]